jgi:hypothetical protein
VKVNGAVRIVMIHLADTSIAPELCLDHLPWIPPLHPREIPFAGFASYRPDPSLELPLIEIAHQNKYNCSAEFRNDQLMICQHHLVDAAERDSP